MDEHLETKPSLGSKVIIEATQLPRPKLDLSSPINQGRMLELAVSELQHFILSRSPLIKKGAVKIGVNQTICVDSVKHEIDVAAQVDIAPGYQATYIFECKNRKQPVSKNDILIFSEKIKASESTRGVFVAKTFTKGAVAQAKKDPRIDLAVVKQYVPPRDELPGGLEAHFHVLHLGIDAKNWDSGGWWSADPAERHERFWERDAKINGRTLPVKDFVKRLVRRSLILDGKGSELRMHEEGSYACRITIEHAFEEVDFRVYGQRVKLLKISLNCELCLYRKIHGHFEFDSGRRVFFLGPMTDINGAVHTGVVITTTLDNVHSGAPTVIVSFSDESPVSE